MRPVAARSGDFSDESLWREKGSKDAGQVRSHFQVEGINLERVAGSRFEK